MLKIDGLCKTYREGEAPVLADFNLALEDGEFVSLIGPSGCGKTTALRIVTGLLTPSAGTIEVNSRPSLGPSREKAIVFQDFNLFPWRSALANAAYGLEMQRMPKRERLRIAAEYLERVGLEEYMHHFPGQLSGGQRQRVGIARALAVRPKLLLMDEPFGALDALTREQLHGVLQQICEQEGVTVLFVTHSIDEAIYLSDRIVAMAVRPGRIVADIPVDLPRPRDAYDWRADPAYAALRAQIWSLLESELTRSQAVPAASGT
jgi:NitT/TauT family transport system ATP-binding protein